MAKKCSILYQLEQCFLVFSNLSLPFLFVIRDCLDYKQEIREMSDKLFYMFVTEIYILPSGA